MISLKYCFKLKNTFRKPQYTTGKSIPSWRITYYVHTEIYNSGYRINCNKSAKWNEPDRREKIIILDRSKGFTSGLNDQKSPRVWTGSNAFDLCAATQLAIIVDSGCQDSRWTRGFLQTNNETSMDIHGPARKLNYDVII